MVRKGLKIPIQEEWIILYRKWNTLQTTDSRGHPLVLVGIGIVLSYNRLRGQHLFDHSGLDLISIVLGGRTLIGILVFPESRSTNMFVDIAPPLAAAWRERGETHDSIHQWWSRIFIAWVFWTEFCWIQTTKGVHLLLLFICFSRLKSDRMTWQMAWLKSFQEVRVLMCVEWSHSKMNVLVWKIIRDSSALISSCTQFGHFFFEKTQWRHWFLVISVKVICWVSCCFHYCLL
jgi:hypothetical protein